MMFGVPMTSFLACVAVAVVQSLTTIKCIRDYRNLES